MSSSTNSSDFVCTFCSYDSAQFRRQNQTVVDTLERCEQLATSFAETTVRTLELESKVTQLEIELEQFRERENLWKGLNSNLDSSESVCNLDARLCNFSDDQVLEIIPLDFLVDSLRKSLEQLKDVKQALEYERREKDAMVDSFNVKLSVMMTETEGLKNDARNFGTQLDSYFKKFVVGDQDAAEIGTDVACQTTLDVDYEESCDADQGEPEIGFSIEFYAASDNHHEITCGLNQEETEIRISVACQTTADVAEDRTCEANEEKPETRLSLVCQTSSDVHSEIISDLKQEKFEIRAIIECPTTLDVVRDTSCKTSEEEPLDSSMLVIQRTCPSSPDIESVSEEPKEVSPTKKRRTSSNHQIALASPLATSTSGTLGRKSVKMETKSFHHTADSEQSLNIKRIDAINTICVIVKSNEIIESVYANCDKRANARLVQLVDWFLHSRNIAMSTWDGKDMYRLMMTKFDAIHQLIVGGKMVNYHQGTKLNQLRAHIKVILKYVFGYKTSHDKQGDVEDALALLRLSIESHEQRKNALEDVVISEPSANDSQSEIAVVSNSLTSCQLAVVQQLIEVIPKSSEMAELQYNMYRMGLHRSAVDFIDFFVRAEAHVNGPFISNTTFRTCVLEPTRLMDDFIEDNVSSVYNKFILLRSMKRIRTKVRGLLEMCLENDEC
ncbi:hypothetical protein HDE_12811 [Halotydeus destructor]|nr:hypothetical protein HDE_12811 [Halotydeus destructor]